LIIYPYKIKVLDLDLYDHEKQVETALG